MTTHDEPSLAPEPVPPAIEASLRELLFQDNGEVHYSEAEHARRRDLLAEHCKDRGLEYVIVFSSPGRSSALTWWSEWRVTNEAVLVMRPDRPEDDVLLVQYFNHVPLAKEMSRTPQVRWGGNSTLVSLLGLLEERSPGQGSIGYLGPLPYGSGRELAAKFGQLTDLNLAYAGWRLTKSPEELQWFRLAARLTDLGAEALERQVRPGMTERDLGAIVEAAYLPFGATNAIHYFSINDQSHPGVGVPRQFPSTRVLSDEDVVSAELSANYAEHNGQVLRTYTFSDSLDGIFGELHDVAVAAFEAIERLIRPGVSLLELVAASAVIEQAGFTTIDDLIHGYGGGYFEPILGSTSRTHRPVPADLLQEGQMLVVQPNVVTTDHRAGVQTGECLVVGKQGAERLHRVPRGLRRFNGHH
ncbi:MAG: M24 family metallopeptidase [Acidimicrobiales bacterium]